MGSGPSAPSPPPQDCPPDVLTVHPNSPSPYVPDSDLDTTIPKLDTSWSDDEEPAVPDDLNDIDDLQRDLDSALQSSPKRQPNTSAKSNGSHRSTVSKDSRFLLDSVESHYAAPETRDFPETYAQKLQRVQQESQQPAMLVREHVMVRRDPQDWEMDEDQILDFDVIKFKAVNKTEDNVLHHSPRDPVMSSTPRTKQQVQYDQFEEEIMASIERDF